MAEPKLATIENLKEIIKMQSKDIQKQAQEILELKAKLRAANVNV